MCNKEVLEYMELERSGESKKPSGGLATEVQFLDPLEATYVLKPMPLFTFALPFQFRF